MTFIDGGRIEDNCNQLSVNNDTTAVGVDGGKNSIFILMYEDVYDLF